MSWTFHYPGTKLSASEMYGIRDGWIASGVRRSCENQCDVKFTGYLIRGLVERRKT